MVPEPKLFVVPERGCDMPARGGVGSAAISRPVAHTQITHTPIRQTQIRRVEKLLETRGTWRMLCMEQSQGV
jgi:hypothetical protein